MFTTVIAILLIVFSIGQAIYLLLITPALDKSCKGKAAAEQEASAQKEALKQCVEKRSRRDWWVGFVFFLFIAALSTANIWTLIMDKPITKEQFEQLKQKYEELEKRVEDLEHKPPGVSSEIFNDAVSSIQNTLAELKGDIRWTIEKMEVHFGEKAGEHHDEEIWGDESPYGVEKNTDENQTKRREPGGQTQEG